MSTELEAFTKQPIFTQSTTETSVIRKPSIEGEADLCTACNLRKFNKDCKFNLCRKCCNVQKIGHCSVHSGKGARSGIVDGIWSHYLP
jgi:hypothetical protein